MSTVYPLKFILLGDSSTGKTQLSRRFTNKDFRVDSTATVGLEFATREIPFERCVIKAQIWDTAGQERFESMTKVYYRDALGALLVYDATNRTSFENLKNVWLKQLKDYGHESIGMVLGKSKLRKWRSIQDFPFSHHSFPPTRQQSETRSTKTTQTLEAKEQSVLKRRPVLPRQRAWISWRLRP